MNQIRFVLGNPALHLLLGLIFAVLFTWPLVSIEQPIHTWLFMYGFWAVSIVACAALAFGQVARSDDDWSDEGEEEREA